MHFKNPELLYALLLLLIPILVHLFRLRRFRKEKFTNVKFLQKAIQQTRKSSQIKRWLVLFLRMLALASIVIAFAQPFIPASVQGLQETQTLIYLDNSYSMQAKGANGQLLKRSIQDLLERVPVDKEISLFTNDSEYSNLTRKELRDVLQNLGFSINQLNGKAIALKANNLFNQKEGIQRNFILISDFQAENSGDFQSVPDVHNYWVPLKPENLLNIYVDSASVTSNSLEGIRLSISLRSSQESNAEVPVSLYDGSRLLAKQTVSFDGFEVKSSFELPAGPIENGRISIEEPGLAFDNQLFFSINSPETIKVVAIGSGNMSFLERIYREPNFTFDSFGEHQIDFNKLSSSDLVILNEAIDLPPSLGLNLANMARENKWLILIPSSSVQLGEFNPLLMELGLPSYSEKIDQEKLLTGIAFDHPIFESVFEKEVENFQYPMIKSYFRSSQRLPAILWLENEEPFLVQQESVFLFSAALDEENSNFKNSPLVVPTFYNMGNMALPPLSLYYILGQPQELDLVVSLDEDEILKLNSEEGSFIPRQEVFSNKVRVLLEEDPSRAGHFMVQRDSVTLKSLSFNIDRKESRSSYKFPVPGEGIEIVSSIPSVFESIESKNEIDALWKWFVIFALILLLTEMLILKWYK